MSAPRRAWRLIIEDEPRAGAWHMATDRALMEFAGDGLVPATLRIYAWSPPAVSLGKGQAAAVANLERCRADGVEVVRRPTGGWAILHTDELTYSVAANAEEPAIAGPLLRAYTALSAGLIAGLGALGLDARLAPSPAPGEKTGLVACFEVPYNNEITVGGKKLMGSAQARSKQRLMQHGSLPLTGDLGRAATYLTFPTAAAQAALADRLREHATTASAAAGHAITYAAAAAAMARGFAAALGVDLIPGALSPAEAARAAALVAEARVI